MKLLKKHPLLSLISFFFVFATLTSNVSAREVKTYPIPEFTQTSEKEWLNTKPLTREAFLGKVTLVDFWTYVCWNCYRSFPWLHSVEKKLKPEGFQVIGIHSPEFEHDKIHANIIEKMKEFNVTNAVMVDNDMAFWRRMNNRFWPSYFIVDKKGQVRANFIGETHAGDPQAIKIEKLIAKLLAE